MSSFTTTVGHFTATTHGVIISSILITAAFSSLISGNVADTYGRPQTMLFGGAVFSLGTALEAAAPNLPTFLAGRIVAGIGEGFTLSLPVVYICEISPAARRGPLASLPQFVTVVGIACGYFLCYATSRIPASSASWRVPLAFQSLVGGVFALCCTLVPQSPRWLLTKGRPREAAKALARLGITPAEHGEAIDTSVAESAAAPRSLWQSVRAAFADLGLAVAKGVRRRTALGCFLMAMQQFAGIDGILWEPPLAVLFVNEETDACSVQVLRAPALPAGRPVVPDGVFSRLGRLRAGDPGRNDPGDALLGCGGAAEVGDWGRTGDGDVHGGDGLAVCVQECAFG